MNSLDKVVIATKIKVADVKDTVKEKVTNVQFGDSQLVVALVLIVVAIGLCIVFRNQINDLMKDIFGKLSAQIKALSDGTVNAGGTYTPTT